MNFVNAALPVQSWISDPAYHAQIWGKIFGYRSRGEILFQKDSLKIYRGLLELNVKWSSVTNVEMKKIAFCFIQYYCIDIEYIDNQRKNNIYLSPIINNRTYMFRFFSLRNRRAETFKALIEQYCKYSGSPVCEL
jgi:hypothetical protein